MKKILVSALALCLLLLDGCVTATPQPPVVSTLPNGSLVTNTPAPVYAVSGTLAQIKAQVDAAAPAAAGLLALTPAAPVAPLLPSIADGIMGLLVLASGALAAYKNKQSNTANAAAAALASTIYNNPALVYQAHSAAMVNGSTDAVQAHIANAASPV